METEHDVQLSAVFESIIITQRPHKTPTIMSPFENLPPELMRNIFQYAPEAMFELKLVSPHICTIYRSANIKTENCVLDISCAECSCLPICAWTDYLSTRRQH